MMRAADAAAPLVLQPYMLERHPAYRAQLELLSELAPTVRVAPVVPRDLVEHERWAPQRPRVRDAAVYLRTQARKVRREPERMVHYAVGDFPPALHFLLREDRVHIDADDPLNLYRGATRNRISGAHCREVALSLLPALQRGTLTLSFWTQVQLQNFAVTLQLSESGPLLERQRLRVLPPSIPRSPDRANVGRGDALRCLVIASGKFWQKGVGDAVAAVWTAAGAGHAVRLTVVGEGIPEPWAAFTARHAAFTLIGRLPRAELDALYLDHDVLLFPSHHDTYGWVIVEAKARGVPAVATDMYTRPEIVRHGVDGLLVADPFANPYLPVTSVAYAGAFLEPTAAGTIAISPLIAPYVNALAAALVRCHTDREFLRAMGEEAYAAAGPDGRFGTRQRLAALRELLLARS